MTLPETNDIPVWWKSIQSTFYTTRKIASIRFSFYFYIVRQCKFNIFSSKNRNLQIFTKFANFIL
ncbi:hypothetical protein BQ8482_180073 [Mesorhizobium delmotii]|uniref:Uncharacterized protein n=1 Tax=Mesorhizobium delmotii TaxID=1631247 RepID=A0A2P9AI88_9HYPH|nr:hypothetical protein BQ8482_180073 [Mesorhizobium delmotii]